MRKKWRHKTLIEKGLVKEVARKEVEKELETVMID
jgi:hypothetical protein